MNNAMTDNDPQPKGSPIGCFDRCYDTVANVVVIGCGVWNIARQAGDGLQQVGSRHDADDLIASHHRQTLDTMSLHQKNDLVERRLLRHRDRIWRHDLSDPAASFMYEVGCDAARSDEKCQPPTTVTLSADFDAAYEVALRHDTHQGARFVDHRESADMILQHDVCGMGDGCISRDRKDPVGHDLVGAHALASKWD